MSKAPIKMSDIAKLAGVSKSTVSRVLSGNPAINSKTREMVLELVKKHNYRINVQARNFRLKESLTIGVLMPSSQNATWRISDTFFLELIGSISEAIGEHGHQMLLSSSVPLDGQNIERYINENRADGMILIGQGSQHDKINQISSHFRAISVWGAYINEQQKYTTVGTDNVLGGYRATKHLLEQGCENILFLGHHKVPEITQRYQGYQNALKEFDKDYVNKDLCINSINTEESYFKVKTAIQENRQFDGIFAISDSIAMSAVRALREAGKGIPEDVAIVGYDDISLANFFNPPISTIYQNHRMGGRILVDNLLAALEGTTPESIQLDPALIVRASSSRK